jgi:hypothetical protein
MGLPASSDVITGHDVTCIEVAYAAMSAVGIVARRIAVLVTSAARFTAISCTRIAQRIISGAG